MKFSEFAKQNNCDNNQKKQEKSESDFSQNVGDLYDKYKNLSQDELMQQLAKNVREQKQNGTFDFEHISNSINMILPYLSDEQKQTILSLLNGLK